MTFVYILSHILIFFYTDIQLSWQHLETIKQDIYFKNPDIDLKKKILRGNWDNLNMNCILNDIIELILLFLDLKIIKLCARMSLFLDT